MQFKNDKPYLYLTYEYSYPPLVEIGWGWYDETKTIIEMFQGIPHYESTCRRILKVKQVLDAIR